MSGSLSALATTNAFFGLPCRTTCHVWQLTPACLAEPVILRTCIELTMGKRSLVSVDQCAAASAF